MKSKKATKNGVHSKKRMPKWKRHTDDYRSEELTRLKFASRDDSNAAIELLWAGQLRGMPFALDPNDADSLVVPVGGIPFLANAGIKFTPHPAYASA